MPDIGRPCALAGVPPVVLVTHHIEEIGPWIAQALVLKDGAVLPSGAVDHVEQGLARSVSYGGTEEQKKID